MFKRLGTYIEMLTLIDKIVIVALLFFLSISFCGCNVRPELSHRDAAVLDRTEEAWRTAFKSWNTPEDCLENMSIVQVQADAFERLCRKPALFSEGCVQERGIGYAPGKVMYISPMVRPDRRDDAIVHVALHELCKCTAKEDARDVHDDAHRLKDVWIETSGANSLESFIIQGIRNGVMQ